MSISIFLQMQEGQFLPLLFIIDIRLYFLIILYQTLMWEMMVQVKDVLMPGTTVINNGCVTWRVITDLYNMEDTDWIEG